MRCARHTASSCWGEFASGERDDGYHGHAQQHSPGRQQELTEVRDTGEPPRLLVKCSFQPGAPRTPESDENDSVDGECAAEKDEGELVCARIEGGNDAPHTDSDRE